MSETEEFTCPNCGAPLTPHGRAKEVKCAFCGTMAIVPESLREAGPDEASSEEEATPQAAVRVQAVQAAPQPIAAEPQQPWAGETRKKRGGGGRVLRVIGWIIAVIGILFLLLFILGEVGNTGSHSDFIITVIVCPTPLILLGAGLFAWGSAILRKQK